MISSQKAKFIDVPAVYIWTHPVALVREEVQSKVLITIRDYRAFLI